MLKNRRIPERRPVAPPVPVYPLLLESDEPEPSRWPVVATVVYTVIGALFLVLYLKLGNVPWVIGPLTILTLPGCLLTFVLPILFPRGEYASPGMLYFACVMLNAFVIFGLLRWRQMWTRRDE